MARGGGGARGRAGAYSVGSSEGGSSSPGGEINIAAPVDPSAEKEEEQAAPPPDPWGAWSKELTDLIRLDLRAFARSQGQPSGIFDGWFDYEVKDQLVSWITPFVMPKNSTYLQQVDVYNRPAVGGHQGMGPRPNPNYMIDPFTPDGMGQLRNMALNWISQFIPGISSDTSSSSGGGGGGGSRKPTANEIRNMFDLDALTRKAEDMGRAYLVDELPNARSIAQTYIEKVVASSGEKEIDYDTFVLNQLKKSDRWNVIYQNKPDGVDPLKYISMFAGMATEMLGGNRGKGISKIVGHGAALGASPEAFASRLSREDTVRNSSNYINSLEKLMTGASGVLRG